MARKNSLSAMRGLRNLSVMPGAVFLGPWDDIDHEKFLIVAGVSENRLLVCSVMSNLLQVQQRIIASGNLTVDEINTFFKKK